MKYLLFLPAFFLYLLSITSVNDFRKALRRTTSKRQDYLSADGVLGVIGDSMGADEVKLIIRIPGTKRRQGGSEERVLAETWRARGVRAPGREPHIYPIDEEHQLLVAVMKTEGRIKVLTNERDRRAAAESGGIVPPPETLVLIPIKFHGGVIGAVQVIFRGYGKYNDGTLEQLKFIAEHLAPSVQDFRTVAAVDKLSTRLSRVQGGRLADGFEEATQRFVESLQDLLNALGVGLIIEGGFKSLKPIYPQEGLCYEILKEQEASYDEEEKKKVVLTNDGPVRIEQEQLTIRTEKGSAYKLGNLLLAIPDDHDEIDKPALGAYYLTRRMLASLIAQSISNAARTALLTVIQELNDALNVETLTVKEWFEKVEAAIKKAGLLWVIASEGDGAPLRGLPEHVALLGGLDELERESLFGNPVGYVPLLDEDSAARHIICLQLGQPDRFLILGVERAHFGRELNFRSPWKVFLESLANSAGAALARIEDRRAAEARRHWEEEERLRAAENELVETVGIISAMLMHELVNMVQDQSYTVAELLELAGDGDAAALPEEKLIASLTTVKESAAMMLELARTWKEMIRGDECCSCNVQQAARQALRLFRFGLLEKQIEVEPKIPAGVVARVPSNFVALAFASLIGNAIDATKPKGNIKLVVRIDEKEEHILCDVIDDGSPVPEDIVPVLFQRGTTNKNEHSGWGLYLVSRLLKKYEGEAFLSYSNKEATCITLRLPASLD
jgi:signal transduction histidine kinase